MTAVGILISGTGSNMVALVEAMQANRIPARPAVVVSSEPAAPGLARAAGLGVPAAAVDHRAYSGRESFDAAVNARLREAGTEIVACAGFMRLMTPVLIDAWAGRMVNIHPSLLPLFKGLDTHARALEAGVCVHGATVHEVTLEMDAGTILGQAVVPVEAGDTPETLARRVLAREHVLYPRVLANFVSDPAATRRNRVALFPHD